MAASVKSFIYFLGRFFAIMQTGGVLRTQSTKLTTYLRYPVNYIFIKVSYVNIRVGSKYTPEKLSSSVSLQFSDKHL